MEKFVFLLICILIISVGLIKGSVISTDERSYPFIFIKGFVSYSDLANNGVFDLYKASMATSTYRITSLATAGINSTNFTGGDKSIYIGNLNEQRWVLSQQTLAQAGDMSFIRASEGLGINPSFDFIATDDTLPGADIIIAYYNGTTDYITGKLFFSITLVQTTV